MKKRDFFRNKKGDIDLIHSAVIFLILNVIFFVVFFIFVGRASGGTAIYEKIYSKQIALFVDSAKPGMNLTIELGKAYDVARKNNYLEKLVNIDPETKSVNVKLINGGGYSFKHFNDAVVLWREDSHLEKLYIQVKEKSENEI